MFTGTIKKVVFDIKPHLSGDDEQPCTNPPTTGTWPTASTDDQPTAANRGRCEPSTAAGIYG